MAKRRTAAEHEARLIEGFRQARAHARGEDVPGAVEVVRERRTARDTTPEPAPAFDAARVSQLRARLNLSQPVFAAALNVSTPTVRAWEQGQRTPDGAALRLLQVTEADPAPVLEAAAIVGRGGAPRRAAAGEKRERK